MKMEEHFFQEARLKKYFITGIILLLPLALTLAIVLFVVNLLTQPFVGIVKAVLTHYGLFDNGVLFLSADQVQLYTSQLIILVLLFFVTVGLGYLARWFFFHYLLQLWDLVLHRIPFVRSVYKTCQELINTVFASSSGSFKQVVMVPFPSKETLSIGFVTKESILHPLPGRGPLVAVFVPTAPNPTSGFLMLFEEKELIYTDLTVESGFKYVLSCGILAAPFKRLSKEEAQQLSGKEPPQKTSEAPA
jgi:uncharacterized membrane protein